MFNLRNITVLAITILLTTGISVSAVAGASKASLTTSTSLKDLITSLINRVGDDAFSTIDLSTLVNPLPGISPAQHHMTAASSSSSSGTSTQHYGPFSSTDSDSGTCGNDWATDNFNRHFTVFQNTNDGSLEVVEQFKDGNFVTPAPVGDPSRTPNGPSPGACQNSTTPAGVVNDGITGSLHGYFAIPLPPGTLQTSNDPSCVAGQPNTPCTTGGFIDSHFTPCYSTASPTCSVTTFFFHYASGGQGLVMNEWKNASADRGGNDGDIRSANI